MEISEPSVLAKLPRPQTESGHVYLAPVHGLVNGTKRKRQEICAAVDGDSVNIYEVDQGRNLLSCPIPPDCALPCPPCAVRSRKQTGTSNRTIYYVSNRRNEIRLAVIQEEPSVSAQKPVTKSVALDNCASPVVQLAILPGADTHKVLVADESGYFEVHDEALSSRIGRGRLRTSSTAARLVAAQWFTPAESLKSILKARPDIVATADSGSSFILGVFKLSENHASVESHNVELGIWPFSAPSSDLPAELPLDPIVHHKLPISSSLLPQDRDPVKLASKDTRLIVKTQSKVYTFNIALTTPRKINEASSYAPDQLSSIFISDGLTLLSTSSSLQLYNAHFRTLQTHLDISKSGLKRKRSHTPGGPIVFSVYFPKINRVVASRRDQLVAIDLQTTGSADYPSAVRQTSLLSSNIGRGAISQERMRPLDQTCESSIGRTDKHSETSIQWRDTMRKLEQCLQEGDLSDFESIYLENISGKDSSSKGKESLSLTNHKVDYAISKIFEFETGPDNLPTSTTTRNLRILIPAHKIVTKLAAEGYLTAERVNKVLKTKTKSNLDIIKNGRIPQVIAESDPTLALLREYLGEAPYIFYKELCEAVLILLRRALAESKASSSLIVADIQAVNQGADQALISVPQLSNAIEQNVTACLCIAIKRLADVNQGELSTFIRESFAQSEIIALVQFLRQQLFRGGYTRPLQAQSYPSPPPSEADDSTEKGDSPTETPLSAIANVLSSCINAIGPIGVLSLGDQEDFVHTLIPELSSEVEKAMEALRETTYLQGLLRETLRFMESTMHTQAHGKERKAISDVQHSKPGSIVTLYEEQEADVNLDQTSSMLPLSLHAEGRIATTKVRKGDGRLYKRSQREMGMQQDKLRGPYALERLSF